MKIIFNGFHHPVYFPIISGVIDEFKVDKCHVIYNEVQVALPPSVAATFHKAADITWGDYHVSWEKILPLEEDLIKSMQGCEAMVLKMMDRLEVAPLTYGERKRLYLKHLRYWNHILEKGHFDLFLSSSPPHEVYDFIIYELCKLKKIPTLFLFQVRVSDTITMMEDWENNMVEIKTKFDELLKKYETVDEKDIELVGRCKRDFELNTSSKDHVHFDVVKNIPIHTILASTVAKLKKIPFNRFMMFVGKPVAMIKKIATSFRRIYSENKLFKFYKKNSTVPDLKARYIYFPLHLQPEVTTSPLAGVFAEQLLIAQMIAYTLPKDVLIYVKEHLFQTIIGRDIDFYKEFLKIPQVRLVPSSFSTFELLKNSLAVATATGTAGWEALYRGKPVLMFGHNFYQFARGVFSIMTIQDCEEALDKIITQKYAPTLKDLKIFLKALEDTTIEGCVDLGYKVISSVTDEISIRNISQALTIKIKSICSI